MSVLTDLKTGAIQDVFFVVCDGLKALPEVAGNALATGHRPDVCGALPRPRGYADLVCVSAGGGHVSGWEAGIIGLC
jgi:hypothetical protein